MPFALPSMLKVGAILVVLLIVGAVLWTVRAELIDKGENIVKAQDNAALVKAQADQARRDAVLIASQNSYINDLQNAGTAVKEKIRVVQAPCTGDGAGDPRLGIFDDWMRSRANDNGAAASGRQPKAALPATGK